MNNDCINTKIEKALKDINITNIMNKASKRFSNQLDSDTIYTCQLNALWKSFVNFKPEKGTKFTTYLYNGVFIECIKEVKFNKKSIVNRKMHNNIPSIDYTYLMVEILDELSTEEERDLIVDKFSNMTIDEMAKKRNSNRETTRKKLNRVLDKLRKKFATCV